MSRSLQLFDQPPFPHPTRLGSAHYVPVLKTLTGEMHALENVPSAARDRMTPLVEVHMTSKGTDEAPRSSPLPGLPQAMALILRDRPFFLDFRGLSPRQEVRVGHGKARRSVPAIEYVLGECGERGLNFVPVVRPGLDARLVDLFREVTDADRGACLRLPVSWVLSTRGFGAELVQLLDLIGMEPEVTDVVIDLQYIEPEPGFEARHIRRVLESLPHLADWRSVVLIGTVIPPNLSGFWEDHITPVARHEWRLWNELRSLGTLRLPTFGDYAIQHPTRPSGGTTSKIRG